MSRAVPGPGPEHPRTDDEPLIGRAAELGGVLARIHDDGLRRLVVTGRAGVGKTAFASAVARHVGAELGTTIAVVSTAGARDTNEVLVRLGRELDVAGTGSDLGIAILDRLRRSGPVVVLDGGDGLDFVDELLTDLADATSLVLLTARRAPTSLPVDGVHLLPFPVPADGDGPDDVRSNPAVRLFVRRAHEVDPTFRPDDDEVVAIGDLVRRLDGLPLAIRLAAARIAMMRPSAMVREMRRLGAWQLVGLSLADEVEANLRELDDSTRRLVRALRVFVGGAGIEAVHNVAAHTELGTTIDALGRLVDLDLVTVDRARARYALTAAVSDHLARSGDDDLDPERSRHADHFAETARPRLRDGTDHALTVDHGNRLAAVEWLEASGRPERVLRLLVDMGEDFEKRGEQIEARQRLTTALARVAAPDSGTAARAHLLLARFTAESPEPTDRAAAIEHLVTARQAAAESERESIVLAVLLTICENHTLLRAFDLAEDAITDGLARTDDGRNPYAEVGFLTWRAVMLHQRGDEHDAASVCADAIRKATSIGDRRLVVRSCLVFLGLPAPVRASVVVDMPSPDELVAMARADDDVRGEGWITALVAGNAVDDGEGVRAASVARDLLDLSQRRANAPLGRLALAVAVRLAAGTNEQAVGARILGALDRHGAVIEASIAPHSFASFARARAGIETALGTDRFAAERGRGGAMSWSDLVEEAATFLGSIVDGSVAWRPVAGSPIDGLSPRERDVLAGLVAGSTNKEIAARLDLRPKTVMHHCSAIFRKLGVESRSGAVAAALRHGFDS